MGARPLDKLKADLRAAMASDEAKHIDGTEWAGRAIARLRKLHKTGLTYTQIAEAMGCSRNSVAGQAHRLGLKR